VQERVRTLGEFAQATSWFDLHAVQLPVDELAASGKGRAPKEIADLLTACQERTDSMRSFEHESLEAALRALAEEKGVGASELFMALRIALTGRKATPPLFETMAVLGRAAVAQRLRAAAEALKAFKPKT
jgi:glutamyl-tRNA synthetase